MWEYINQPPTRWESFLTRWGSVFSIVGGIISIFNSFWGKWDPIFVFRLYILIFAILATIYIFISFRGWARKIFMASGIILCLAIIGSIFLPWSLIERGVKSLGKDKWSSWAMNHRIRKDFEPLRFTAFSKPDNHPPWCGEKGYYEFYQATVFELLRSEAPPWKEIVISYKIRRNGKENWKLIKDEVFAIIEKDPLGSRGTCPVETGEEIIREDIWLDKSDQGCRVVVCGKTEEKTSYEFFKNLNLVNIKVKPLD